MPRGRIKKCSLAKAALRLWLLSVNADAYVHVSNRQSCTDILPNIVLFHDPRNGWRAVGRFRTVDETLAAIKLNKQKATLCQLYECEQEDEIIEMLCRLSPIQIP
ncbi:MAG: hypothetical protein ACKVZH_29360 [Blastocatellia bacterium]